MSPGVFVKKLAKILGLPSKSVVVIDRALLEAGLRSRGGRGRSAPKLTVSDTATLLLAVMATPVLVRADEAILAWSRVKSLNLPDSAPEPFGSIFEARAPLSLLEVMERLIQTPPEDYGDLTLVLEVSADQHAAMLFVRKGGRRCFEVGFVRYVDQETGADKARPAPPAPGDMTRYSKVTESTFHKLYGLFAPLPDPDARSPSPESGRRT
jgi:hypothetical protein